MDHSSNLFCRRRRAVYAVQFLRGVYYQRGAGHALSACESPLCEPLTTIGLDGTSIRQILKKYPHHLVRVWSDVTLAAIEHQGHGFFRRSPAAFLVDNLKAAHRGGRTPPDWFLGVQKQEQTRLADAGKRSRSMGRCQAAETTARSGSLTRALPARLSHNEAVTEMTAQFMAAGQTKAVAGENARKFVAAQTSRKLPAG